MSGEKNGKFVSVNRGTKNKSRAKKYHNIIVLYASVFGPIDWKPKEETDSKSVKEQNNDVRHY